MKLFKKSNTSDDASNYKHLTVKVSGMHCEGCSSIIVKSLSRIDGVSNVRADFDNGEVQLEFKPDKLELEKVRHAIRKVGYIPGVEQIGG